jgi:5-deoxy-glucuronate isomerase
MSKPSPGSGASCDHPSRLNAVSSDLLRTPSAREADGAVVRVDPATEVADLGGRGWEWISFSAHELEPGSRIERPGDGQEVAVVVLDGTVSLVAAGRSFGEVGGRGSVFDARPSPLLLVAPGEGLEIEARDMATIALAAAPGGDVRVTTLVDPGTVRVESRGEGATARTVRHLLPPEAHAGRLIVVEVLTPGGHWSSYPPHKHDEQDLPRETRLEELYYYRFRRPSGFAFQRVYTADRSLDEALTPMDGDLVLVPRGYHAVGVPAGYECYYLNVMAGPVREWRFTLDPDHAWLMDWSPQAADD